MSALRKAVEFLLSKQQASGGWGESYLSCEKKTYHELLDAEGNPTPHLVNTEATPAIARVAPRRRRCTAARCILSRQCANGDFPQQSIMGVFQANCDLVRLLQKHIRSALGEYAQSRRRREMNAKTRHPARWFRRTSRFEYINTVTIDSHTKYHDAPFTGTTTRARPPLTPRTPPTPIADRTRRHALTYFPLSRSTRHTPGCMFSTQRVEITPLTLSTKSPSSAPMA